MKKFDTKVQHLKYQVLKEVATHAWNDTLLENMHTIPKTIISGKEATMRCCVYKERAILTERIQIAMGGDKMNDNVVEVIEIACDECPSSGLLVTPACRGCLAHRCKDVCKKDAINYDSNHVAYIDNEKCIGCGACAKVCPYHAIISLKRPCETACKVKAIRKSDTSNAAKINNDKCISCGACIYQCPFGSISDKSFILDAIKLLKNSSFEQYKVYAVVAPSISGQFQYARLGQVITGIKKLGFHTVVEAALGADIVALSEAEELSEKEFLTSSCCPAFVKYIENDFPALQQHVSHNLSPMGAIAKYIKDNDPSAKIIFIGPCTAKKMELQKDTIRNLVDTVLTFEELQALFDSKSLDINSLEDDVLDNASFYGRIFARSGGLSEAVKQALNEQNLNFELNAIACDGIEAAKIALLKKSKGVLKENFIEGMACVNGCIGGAGCLTHGPKNKSLVDSYGKEAYEKTLLDAVSLL